MLNGVGVGVGGCGVKVCVIGNLCVRKHAARSFEYHRASTRHIECMNVLVHAPT